MSGQPTEAYHGRLDKLIPILVDHGSLGVLLIDMSRLCRVECDFGSDAYQKLFRATSNFILKRIGTEVRKGDLLMISDKGDDTLLVFLSPRRTDHPVRISALEAVGKRIEAYLNRSLVGLSSPYLHEPFTVRVGSAIVLNNPLVSPERLMAQLVEEARGAARFGSAGSKQVHHLKEILLNGDVVTALQPICDLHTRDVLGYEAFSRGPADTDLEHPRRLFEVAAESGLTFQLDRLCRRRALASARSLAPSLQVFVNVLPASMSDPEFAADEVAGVLSGLELEPRQLVLEMPAEILEQHRALFAKRLADFAALGVFLAIDKLGSRSSALEKLAHLHPPYLKIDPALVREIDRSYVRREMIRAFQALAEKMQAKLIAVGIERQEELDTLLELGVGYGQGFLLGRPEPRRGESSREVTLSAL